MSAALDSATAVEIRALQLAQGAVTPQALLDAAAEFAIQSLSRCAGKNPAYWRRRAFTTHVDLPYRIRIELGADFCLRVLHGRSGRLLVSSAPGCIRQLAWPKPPTSDPHNLSPTPWSNP